MSYSSLASEADSSRQFVTALARGLALLATFQHGDHILTNQQLAARTGLPKSTVARLSYTLTRLGYLEHDVATGGYRPGLAALTLASSVLANFDIRQVAAPLMRAFSLTHAISTSLGVLDGTDMVYLETCRSQARVSVALSIGSRVPLATTAIGRACYAALPQTEQARLIPQLTTRYGQAWPLYEEKLYAACQAYHSYGFCMSLGEFEPDVMAVGVALPLLGNGQAYLGLNASGPAFAFDEKQMAEHIGPALLTLRDQILPRPTAVSRFKQFEYIAPTDQ